MTDLVIPRFHTGETLPSMLKRTAAVNQLGSERSAAKALLDEAWRCIRVDVPFGLGQIGSGLWDLFGNRMDVLSEHTLLNAFLACMTPGRRKKYLSRLSRQTRGCLLPVRLPITLSPSPFCEWYCPQCDVADIRLYCETYSRCVHVLPFVSRCVEHDEFLLNRLLIPSEAAQRFVGSVSQREASVVFAKQMVNILRIRHDDSFQLHADLIHHLTELGYMQSGRIHWLELIESFQKQFVDRFEDRRLNTLVSDEAVLKNWLERLLRWRVLHPAHAALIRMFEIPARSVRITHPKRAQYALPTVDDVKGALQTYGSIAKAAQYLKVGREQVDRVARENNLDVRWRPRKVHRELQTQIVEEAQAGVTPFVIAQRFSISLSSVYRYLPKREAARGCDRETHVEVKRQKTRAQLEVAASYGLSLAELRRSQPTLWRWAHRHDRRWLWQFSANIGASGRDSHRRPHHFSCDMVDVLKVARQSVYSANRRPLRLSPGRVVRASGFSEYLGKKLINHCAPETRVTFSEARVNHVARRIHFGEQVYGLGVDLNAVSYIARCVRLRPETVWLQVGGHTE